MKILLEAATALIMEHLPNNYDTQTFYGGKLAHDGTECWSIIIFKQAITTTPLQATGIARLKIEGNLIIAYSYINAKTYVADLANPTFPMIIAAYLISTIPKNM